MTGQKKRGEGSAEMPNGLPMAEGGNTRCNRTNHAECKVAVGTVGSSQPQIVIPLTPQKYRCFSSPETTQNRSYPSPSKACLFGSMVLKREELERHNIYYNDDPQDVLRPRPGRDFPPHFQRLQQTLLDFDCTIHVRFAFEEEDVRDMKWDEAYVDCDCRPEEIEAVKRDVYRYQEMQAEADACRLDGVLEHKWDEFYLEQYLKRLARENYPHNSDTRRISRIKCYYDSFKWNKSREWTLFGKDKGLRPDRWSLSTPKPDFVASFPIYRPAKVQSTNSSNRWPWRGSIKAFLSPQFSHQTLEYLSRLERPLEPNQAGIFKKGRREPIKDDDLGCYPWLIVEHKKADHTKTEECYCQAANAARAALRMHEILARYAEEAADYSHIPPVTTMTTVGSIVRVWISRVTYNKAREESEYQMDCIWDGDVLKFVDTVELEAILENLHTWAMRELKPWIARYIDMWLLHHPLPLHNPSTTAGSDQHMLLKRINTGMNEMPESVLGDSQEEMRDFLRAQHEILYQRLAKLFSTEFHMRNEANCEQSEEQPPVTDSPTSRPAETVAESPRSSAARPDPDYSGDATLAAGNGHPTSEDGNESELTPIPSLSAEVPAVQNVAPPVKDDVPQNDQVNSLEAKSQHERILRANDDDGAILVPRFKAQEGSGAILTRSCATQTRRWAWSSTIWDDKDLGVMSPSGPLSGKQYASKPVQTDGDVKDLPLDDQWTVPELGMPMRHSRWSVGIDHPPRQWKSFDLKAFESSSFDPKAYEFVIWFDAGTGQVN